MYIDVKLKAKWRLKTNHNYVWTVEKMLVNTDRNTIIRKTTLGNSTKAGYRIKGNFIKCEDLRSLIELIPKENDLPF